MTAPPVPEIHRFAHQAMDTTFEALIAGKDATYARQAADAVFYEIDRIEGMLSRFDPGSDVAQIGRLRPGSSLRVSLEVYECLRIAARIHDETGGAFDATVGPLMRCWRTDEGEPRQPTDEEIAAARRRVGMHRLEFSAGEASAEGFSIGVRAAAASEGEAPLGIEIDLGGIGKGYALDCAAQLLEDWSIESALLHGGTSTALAIGTGGPAAGCPPGLAGWPVGIGGDWSAQAGFDRVLLRGDALSGSGTEARGAHILDCRTGRPTCSHLGAWVACPSATEADALSTAFMVMSDEDVAQYCATHPDVAALLVAESPNGEPGSVSVRILNAFRKAEET